MLTRVIYDKHDFVRVIYLDSGQHACGGHTEVQVGQHLSCRGLINLWRPLSGEIIWEKRAVTFCYFLTGQKLITYFHCYCWWYCLLLGMFSVFIEWENGIISDVNVFFLMCILKSYAFIYNPSLLHHHSAAVFRCNFVIITKGSMFAEHILVNIRVPQCV